MNDLGALGFTAGVETEHDQRDFTPVCTLRVGIEQARMGREAPLVAGIQAHRRAWLCTIQNDRSWRDCSEAGSIVAMNLKKVVAINLRRLRHEKGMTLEELARKAQLSARYIGAIERAEVSARVTALGQIAEALEVGASELLRALPSRGRK